jgi:UDP-glucuronate decarboxylase
MRILVTGGAGFIGSHLCQKLIDDKHEVICLDNLFTSRKKNIYTLLNYDSFEFWRYDVCDSFHIECDQIYHLACPASPVHYQRNPVQTIKTATLGTLNALELARNTGARLLIASTSEVYGDPQVHPQPESYYGYVNPVGDRACYDEGKRVGEALAISWTKQYRTDVRIARLFNVYGPKMASDDGRMIPNFVNQALRNESITIYGDGNQTRSLCFVDDIVEGMINLMSYAGEIIPFIVNLGNPEEKSVAEIARDILNLTKSMSDIQFLKSPEDDPKRRCPDISKATEILGWNPKVDYLDGLENTIRWFKENI